MGYVLGTTPGGNKFIAGSSTFSDVWPEGSEAVALDRDNIDKQIRLVKKALTTSDNAATISENGWFQVLSATVATSLGLPTNTMGHLESMYANTSYARQVWYPQGREGVWDRVMNSGVWGAWKRRGTAHGLTNDLLVQDFTRRRGPVKTGGLGAVALRFDHGLGNFDTKIRPLLEARGLPYSLALNSRDWGKAENGGVTAATVDGWVSGGLAEVWNHGAHHLDATDTKALEDTIVTGLAELRSQLPSAVIDGFAVPGVGGTNYQGFDGGATLEDFYNTEAGRLILSHHAVSTGYLSGTTHRALDGTVRQGQLHYTIDTATGTGVEYQINLAAADRTGLQLMLHPSLVDTAGNITTAKLTEILDHIVAKRDAGELAVLSSYDLVVADATTPGSTVTADPDVAGAYIID